MRVSARLLAWPLIGVPTASACRIGFRSGCRSTTGSMVRLRGSCWPPGDLPVPACQPALAWRRSVQTCANLLTHPHLMLCRCAAPCPWRLCGTSLPGMPMHSELMPPRHSTAQVFHVFPLSCWLCVRSGTRVLLNCVRCCLFDKCCLCMCVSLRSPDPAPLAPPPSPPLACRLAVTSNLLVGDADSQAGSRAREA